MDETLQGGGGGASSHHNNRLLCAWLLGHIKGRVWIREGDVPLASYPGPFPCMRREKSLGTRLCVHRRQLSHPECVTHCSEANLTPSYHESHPRDQAECFFHS